MVTLIDRVQTPSTGIKMKSNDQGSKATTVGRSRMFFSRNQAIKSALSTFWSDQDPRTLVYVHTHNTVSAHIRTSLVSIHFDLCLYAINWSDCLLCHALLVLISLCTCILAVLLHMLLSLISLHCCTGQLLLLWSSHSSTVRTTQSWRVHVSFCSSDSIKDTATAGCHLYTKL